MGFDIDKFYDNAYKKVDVVPFGYLEYRLTYAPSGYVYCADVAGNAVYVKKRQDESLAYQEKQVKF